MEIAEGGTYTRLRLECVPGQNGGGIRGRIRGFSRRSRKRLLDLLNQVHRSVVASALFVTLTYPDHFPQDPERWKRDLDAFFKRFRRKYPTAAVIWRLEFKTRKSGDNEGKIAPHFHLLVFNLPLFPKDLLARWWYEIVGSGDPRHLQAGTRVERVRSWRGVMWYASKYIGKEDDEGFDLEAGRVWGVVGRENLPIHLIQIPVTWTQFYRMRRVLRRWLSRRLKRKLKYAGLRGQGMTAYLDADSAARLLAWAVL